MEQHTTKNFDVIGLCSKMQTLSLEQEDRLCDGICYDIDFFQNFQSMYVEGLLITDVPVARLIKVIDYLTNKTVSPSAGYFPQKENDRYGDEDSHFDWDWFFEQQKKERKREKNGEKSI